MLPLARQVLIACDAAKLCAARLAGMEAPTLTRCPSWARIRKTLDFLATVPEIDGTEARTSPSPWVAHAHDEGRSLPWATANSTSPPLTPS
jgi:hypothetical protein